MNYIEQLRESARKSGSIVCMGLDPVLEAMPESYSRYGIESVPDFLGGILGEMKSQGVSVGAFKPNQGFYIRHDEPRRWNFPGSKSLAIVMDIICGKFPGVPIILDYKRGDIAKSSENYAVEGFDRWKADAVTISPYFGTDSVMPFFKPGKGVYVLDRTSNNGASEFQNLDTRDGKLYSSVALAIRQWAEKNPGVGAVVGATSIKELDDLAFVFANNGGAVPLLIPGVGGQGGRADEVVAALRKHSYDLSIVRINSSSGLTHPWKTRERLGEIMKETGKTYAQICVDEIRKLNEQIGYKAA